jgi:hypothetical protein
MAQLSINCPYCGAAIPPVTVNEESTHKFTIKLYEYEHSSSRESVSYEVKCPLCRMEYEYIDLTDFSWIRNHLELSDTALTTFKTYFIGEELEALHNNIIGVTRPKKRFCFWKRFLHICFSIGGVRAYLDCCQKKDKLQGINVYKV